MTLKGDRRTTYMREYMRRRRARKTAPVPAKLANKPERPAPDAKLRQENTRLRAEIAELRAIAPDASKIQRLSEKVRDLKAELRRTIKNRDANYVSRHLMDDRERAISQIDGSGFSILARAVHPDTGANASPEDRHTATIILNKIRPLFRS